MAKNIQYQCVPFLLLVGFVDKVGKYLRGKKFRQPITDKDFKGCLAGQSIFWSFALTCLTVFISGFLGLIYGISVIQIIAGLISNPLEILIVVFGISICLLISFVVFLCLSFVYIIIDCLKINLGRYFLLIFNFIGILIGSFLIKNSSFIHVILSLIVIISLHAISMTVSDHSKEENHQCYWLRVLGMSCVAIGGTSFYGMDLEGALFDDADLCNTDFREANLAGASFIGAKHLELALVKGTILEDSRVRNLLINPRSGEGKSFAGANFQGANIRDANLRGANLTLVNAIDTDFTGANLDDVCIQDWNISKNTKFRGVQCRRVYLKQNKQEPKPDSGEFQEGEFEKWVTEIQDTVDLIFRKGLNLRSLAFAIAQVSIDNEETQLTVESIAHKGDDFVVVKVGKQGNATKEKIHAALTNEYHQAQQAISTGHDLILRAKDDQIEQMRSYIHAQEKHIQGLISCIAQPREPMIVTKIYSTQQGDIMEGQKIQAGGNIEQGNRIIAGGDFTSTGSTTNLGEMEISGQVTNSIQQLQDIQTSDSQELAQILTALQAAIQDEQNLPPAVKTVSLENVKILSEEAKKEPAQRSKSILEKAVDFLSGIGKIVGDTSKLAEVCKTHLPTLSNSKFKI